MMKRAHQKFVNDIVGEDPDFIRQPAATPMNKKSMKLNFNSYQDSRRKNHSAGLKARSMSLLEL